MAAEGAEATDGAAEPAGVDRAEGALDDEAEDSPRLMKSVARITLML